jgi:hypothetical protein
VYRERPVYSKPYENPIVLGDLDFTRDDRRVVYAVELDVAGQSGTARAQPWANAVGSAREDTGERLVVTQALSLTKNPQNQARIPRFFNCALNPERKLAEASWRRNLNAWNMFSGDDRDRTGNLLVANQSLCGDEKRCKLLLQFGL